MSVTAVIWPNLRQAQHTQLNENRTDRNIKSEIDHKQRHNESFEKFYGVIMALTDKLSTPLSEASLVETLSYNLLPEIQHEILCVPTSAPKEL